MRGDYETIRTVIESYVGLFYAVGDKKIDHRPAAEDAFRREDREDRDGGRQRAESPPPSAEESAATAAATEGQATSPSAEPRRNNHGRNGADAYSGAEKIEVRHESLQPGDPCPKCEDGTVYETNRPGVLVRLLGQAQWGPRFITSRSCAAVFAAWYSPPIHRQAWARRRSTIRRSEA